MKCHIKTVMPRLKIMLRRHIWSIIYHTTIISLVFLFLAKYGNIWIVSDGREPHEIRNVDSKMETVDLGNSLPLDDDLVEKSLGEQTSKTEEDIIRNTVQPEKHIVLLGEGGSHQNSSIAKERLQQQLPNIPANYLPGPNSRGFPRKPRVRVVPGEGPGIHLQMDTSGKSHQRSKGGIGRDQNFLQEAHQPLRVDVEGVVRGLATPQPASRTIGRSNVLIIAAMRTGSSFLGELFKQRDDFFYMFEPGMQIMHKLDSLNLTRRVIYTKLLDMINDFYACKFESVPFFIDELNKTTLTARKQSVPALVSPQFCRPRTQGQRPRDACDDPTVEVLERACTTRGHTAIKSIRVLDINLVTSAVKDPNTNLKLIHLVRDPRSMILSRLKLNFPTIHVFNVTQLSDTYLNILYKYCSSWLQNYEIGHYVPLMRQNYLMVRYEDLALEPYLYAKKIYDFVGVGAEIPSTMQTWLEKNTNANDPGSKDKVVAFSTQRDSKSVLVKWKTRLTLEMAKAIEEVGDCTRLMKATGYKLIGDNFEMLNNTDHLVDNVPVPALDITAFDFM